MVRSLAFLVGGLLVVSELACGRSPTAPTSFSATGTWEGQFQVNHCETNWIDVRNCAYNRTGYVRLRLTQRGDEVVGSLVLTTAATVVANANGIPVSGRKSEQALTLAGGSTEGDLRRLVENWSATVVSDGRSGSMIQATFDIRVEQPGTCLSFSGCIDPIVWKRAYSTSPMRRVNE
jgi:hypothetical protein